jgi:hypothetical protein
MMSPAIVAIGLQLIVLHRPDGIEIAINPQHVVALHVSLIGSGHIRNRLFAEKAFCVLDLAGSHRMAVTETCDDVRRLLEEVGGQ